MWIAVIISVTLFGVIYMTRSVMMSQVIERADTAVDQEIEEFYRFADDGVDPETQEPFSSVERLLEVYMSRQYPDDNETMVGLVGGQLIQFDFRGINGHFPTPIEPDSPLAIEIFNAEHSAGVTNVDEDGPVHWSRAAITDDNGQTSYLVAAYFSGDARSEVNEQISIITTVGIGGLLVAIFIAYLIAGQIITPVRRLSTVAREITNDDLSQRVPAHGNDELAELATTFNEMLDRLEVAYRDQRQFVDDAGHELRTPITVVRGQLELLETARNEEERNRSIDLAIAELDRMSRMVNDMLILAVADSGNFITTAPTDITELMIDIEDKAATLSERVQLVEVAEGPQVLLDEYRVTEAILELVGNALRYSEDVVEIGSEFNGQAEERELRIWVRDRGQGIRWDRQSTLFDRFSRGEQTENNRPKGAGLGLSIVDAIGKAHGGRAYVDSTVGLGSVFGLIIPAPTNREKEEQS